MTAFVGSMLGVSLPDPSPWIVSRADITENLRLADHAQVRQALSILRKGANHRGRERAPRPRRMWK